MTNRFSGVGNGNSELERALNSLVSLSNLPMIGNVYVAMLSSDPGYVDFMKNYQVRYSDGTYRIHNTIASAYNAMTTDRHDLLLVNGYGAFAQTSMLTISNSRCHFASMDFMRGGNYGMGASSKITMGVTTNATDLGVLKNTGVRNTFSGIKFDSANTKAESIYGLVEAGEYAIYEGCEFYKSTDLDVSLSAEVLNNGDSTQWNKCSFGSSANETVGAVIRPCMLLTATIAGAKCRDNIAKDCNFLTKSANSARVDVYGANATDVERMFKFKDCTFYSNPLGSATPAHAVGFGSAQTEGCVILEDCTSIDHTVMAQASKGIYVQGSVPTFATTGVSVAA